MGVDIHMHLINKEEIIKKNLYDGRNSSWFDALTETYYEGYEVYKYLPTHHGIPAELPPLFAEYTNDEDYYGHHYISLVDFVAWFNFYKPHIKAGWVHTYDAWLYNTKRIDITEDDVYHYMTEGTEGYTFLSYVDSYEPAWHVIKSLAHEGIISKSRLRGDLANRDYVVNDGYTEAIITFCFDR